MRRAILSLVVVLPILVAAPAHAESDIVIEPKAWRVVKSESGPVSYYAVASEDEKPFVRGSYKPPLKTVVLGYQLADEDRQRAKKVRWTWRAVTLPQGGDECSSKKADSAAVVYVTWKRGLRYYSLKYVWSAVSPKGSVCDSKRNPFAAQDTVIVESGGPLNTWRSVEIDLAKNFRHHFASDNPNAPVPDLVGIGIMSDGDQTKSESVADYGTFTIER
jgi:hypothetical protein